MLLPHLYLLLRYSTWAFEFLLVPPIREVAIVAASNLVLSGLTQRPFGKHLWKRGYWLVITHWLFFVAILAVGVLGEVIPGSSYNAGSPASIWLYAFLCGSLLSCVWWVWRMKGIRWFAASVMLLLEVIILSAYAVAGMSISGDWL